MRLLIYIYILTMPFVSAFAFSEHANIPLVIAGILLFCMPIDIINKRKFHYLTLGVHIGAIFTWLCIILVSYFYNSFGNKTTTNHLFAYYTVFFCDFIAIQYCLLKYSEEGKFYQTLLTLINIMVVISTIYGCIEYTLAMNGNPIDAYIPRVAIAEYDANALEGDFLIKRIRGFSEESGHFALMLEIFFPIQIYYLFQSGYSKLPFLAKIILVVISIAAILLTVSTATFICFPIALILTGILFWKKILKHFWKFMVYIIPVSLVVLYIFSQFPIMLLIDLAINKKLNDSTSSNDRASGLSAFSESFSNAPLINKLIGYGPSGYLTAGTKYPFISLYPTFIFESGIFGFIFYLFFHSYVFFKLIKIKNNISFFLTISFLTATLHYFVIGNYWYPWFWFLCAFIIFFNQKEKSGKISIN